LVYYELFLIKCGYRHNDDPRFDSTWAPSLSEEVEQQLNSEEFKKLKNEWKFQVKAEK